MAFLVIASLVSLASAKSFLHPEVGKESIARALLSELSGLADSAQLQTIESEIGSMFASLPKNEGGRLDAETVRYALHRYFMRKHGWYVNGLGPVNTTEESSSSTILKDRAPAYIQKLFEQRLQGRGVNHHELAVFAATLTDLIHKEVAVALQGVYAALDLPTVGPVTDKEHDIASKAYLVAYIAGTDEDSTTSDDADADGDDYSAWEDTWVWFSDVKLTSDLQSKSRLNPFVRQRRSFDRHVSLLQEFGHRLGNFQNLECHRLKDLLVEMEDLGTGRVPLSKFYRGGLDGDWTFTESVDYLRHAGALDEAVPGRPSVVIPNYIQSHSNCLEGSSFYSVCCLDECEGLLSNVETLVQASRAPPARIAEVISGLSSDTIHAPRNISRALMSRLGEIAEHHDGYVPLHGRLFAQWMHHAYPRECQFPSTSVGSRLSPLDWMDIHDLESAAASEDDMAMHVTAVDVGGFELESLPWIMTERMVSESSLMDSQPSIWSRSMRSIAAFLLLSTMASVARESISSRWKGEDRSVRCLV